MPAQTQRRGNQRTGLTPRRDLIMISHANPEDDDVAIWLATQLASEGYKVWCDKVHFLAGEQFWADIDEVIRTRACKVIFVLSRTSNELGYRGFTKELNLALTLQRSLVKTHPTTAAFRRFLLPIAKDHLPTAEYNVHFVGGTNVLPFQSWAQGFSTLLTVLRKDRVPRFRGNTPAAVKNWWNSYRNPSQGRMERRHKLASNFFRFAKWPEYFVVRDRTTAEMDPTTECRYFKGNLCFSFSNTPVKAEHSQLFIEGKSGESIALHDVISRHSPPRIKRYRPDLVALLRICWEETLKRRSDVHIYELANRTKAAYFAKPSDADSLTQSFRLSNSFEGRRKIVGAFGGGTRKDGTPIPKHFYHFAVDVRPIIAPFGLQCISHVIFTDDGETPWSSKKKLHTARRSFCSRWYNDRWRDCLLSWISCLSQGQPTVSIAAGPEVSIELRCLPRLYKSYVLFEKQSDSSSEGDESNLEITDELNASSDLLETDDTEDPEDEED